mgnify:CR=1 FL=1
MEKFDRVWGNLVNIHKYVLRSHSLFVTQNEEATISYPTQGAHNKNRMLEQNHSHFLFTQGESQAASQASRYQYELSLQQSFGEKLNYSAATCLTIIKPPTTYSPSVLNLHNIKIF